MFGDEVQVSGSLGDKEKALVCYGRVKLKRNLKQVPLVKVDDHLSKLKDITNVGKTQIAEVLEKIDRAREINDDIVNERTGAFVHVYYQLSNEVNMKIRETVFAGMNNSMLLVKYPCVSATGNEIKVKLDAKLSKVWDDMSSLKQKSAVDIMTHKPVVTSLQEYLAGLESAAEAELEKQDTAEGVAKVLEDVSAKVRSLLDVVSQINAKIDGAKFKFFEDFVDLTYKAETKMKNDQAAGVKKIKNCLK